MGSGCATPVPITGRVKLTQNSLFEVQGLGWGHPRSAGVCGEAGMQVSFVNEITPLFFGDTL
jgi:hypothetical protein